MNKSIMAEVSPAMGELLKKFVNAGGEAAVTGDYSKMDAIILEFENTKPESEVDRVIGRSFFELITNQLTNMKNGNAPEMVYLALMLNGNGAYPGTGSYHELHKFVGPDGRKWETSHKVTELK